MIKKKYIVLAVVQTTLTSNIFNLSVALKLRRSNIFARIVVGNASIIKIVVYYI